MIMEKLIQQVFGLARPLIKGFFFIVQVFDEKDKILFKKQRTRGSKWEY